jgi:hypothetical protein
VQTFYADVPIIANQRLSLTDRGGDSKLKKESLGDASVLVSH